MNELAMDQLVQQVPDLKLRKRVETRTIHWSDVRENKNLHEGDVIPVISWVDDAGYQWTHADIRLYMTSINAFDKSLEQLDTIIEQIQSERKTVKMELVH